VRRSPVGAGLQGRMDLWELPKRMLGGAGALRATDPPCLESLAATILPFSQKSAALDTSVGSLAVTP